MFINKYLISFLKGNTAKILNVGMLELCLVIISTVISLMSAYIIKTILNDTDIFIYRVLLLFFAIGVLMIAKYIIFKKKNILAVRAGVNIKDNIRNNLMKQIFTFGYAYTSQKRTGELTTTLSNKVDWLNNYYTMYLPCVFSAILNAVIIVSVLMIIDFITALICLTSIIGMIICPMIFYEIMKKRGEKEWEAEGKYYSECLDGIQGIVSLKAFNADGLYRNRIHQQGENLRRCVMSQLKVTMLENGILEFFVKLGSAISVSVISIRCFYSNIDNELIIYAMFLIGACFSPMSTLISAWHIGYKGVTASSGISELLSSKPNNSYFLNKQNLLNLEERIQDYSMSFENVNFSYINDEQVLLNISFYVPAETSIAIIGSSGSGKSTIAQLIAGNYAPQNGKIKIGNCDINAENVTQMQTLISAVWQDSYIFYGTIYDNIAIGNTEASFDEIINAAKLANLHDFVLGLPEKYNTLICERGIRFSGGEKQRIAIARAFLKRAPILILDEATSSLDGKNEYDVQESIKKLSKGRTVVIIAHRLTTIKNVDQICVLKNGRISAIGTHNQLQHTSDEYQKLMMEQ